MFSSCSRVHLVLRPLRLHPRSPALSGSTPVLPLSPAPPSSPRPPALSGSTLVLPPSPTPNPIAALVLPRPTLSTSCPRPPSSPAPPLSSALVISKKTTGTSVSTENNLSKYIGMVTSTSKELLELELRNPSSTKEPKILICNEEACLPGQGRNLRKIPSDGGVDERPSISAVSKSEVLGKVKNFLGIMAEANKQLELDVQENPYANYDIEASNGNETEYIEMDLLLGVADLQTPEAVAAAEATIGGASLPLLSSASNLSSESDTENSSISDDDEDASDGENNNSSTCQKSNSAESLESKPNKRPKIVVLN